jgi:hypothetical protein
MDVARPINKPNPNVLVCLIPSFANRLQEAILGFPGWSLAQRDLGTPFGRRRSPGQESLFVTNRRRKWAEVSYSGCLGFQFP